MLRGRVFLPAARPQEAEELAQTVALYFAEDGDVRRCAEKLFVHRNTFQYRMDTVKRKTGLDLRRPGTRRFSIWCCGSNARRGLTRLRPACYIWKRTGCAAFAAGRRH